MSCQRSHMNPSKFCFDHVKSYRPKFHVGFNPTVHFLCSGFRPRGHYLEVVGMNSEVEKFLEPLTIHLYIYIIHRIFHVLVKRVR